MIGNIYLISAVAVIGGFLYGMDIASMSAILPTQQYTCYFDQSSDDSCAGPHPDVQGGITASMAGGSWLGSLLSAVLTDRLGRRKGIIVACIIWYSPSIHFLSWGFWQLTVPL